jgi:mannan endo-1,4-beta-mannosidase
MKKFLILIICASTFFANAQISMPVKTLPKYQTPVKTDLFPKPMLKGTLGAWFRTHQREYNSLTPAQQTGLVQYFNWTLVDYFTKFSVPKKSTAVPQWWRDLYCQTLPQKCTVVTTPEVVDVPLQVSGRFLTDGKGNRIMLKGVNVGYYGWVSGSPFDRNEVERIAASIKNNATKCNTVRLLWMSEKAGGSGYSLSNLDFLLKTYTDKGFIPVLNLWDALKSDKTSNNSATFDEFIAPFWNNPNVQTIIKKYENKIIINLANEWGHTNWGDGNDINESIYKSKYNALVLQLRTAGIKSPIMIDAPNFGTSSDLLISYGSNIVNNDPLKNILLSVHTYWGRVYGTISKTGCESDYINKIAALKNSNLPFVLGEVSNWADPSNATEALAPIDFTCATLGQDLIPNLIPNDLYNPTAVPNGNTNTNVLFAINYDALLTKVVADEIGFYAWVWYQDGTKTRNLYDHDTGTKINTDPTAGSWPKDMMSNTKVYGLNK